VGDGNRKPRFEVLDLVSLLPVHLSNKLQKIACHNPCYLSKQGIRLSDELTRRGFQIEEVINDCCGAVGGVYFTEPDLAREISKKTVKKIGSDLLVTGRPFCKDQFEKVIDQNKKIIHYIDLFL